MIHLKKDRDLKEHLQIVLRIFQAAEVTDLGSIIKEALKEFALVFPVDGAH